MIISLSIIQLILLIILQYINVFCYQTLEQYNNKTMIMLINLMRIQPQLYKELFSVTYGCEINQIDYPLYYNNKLEEAARAESFYISDPDCPISHETCYKYCHIYNSCNYIDRITYYCPECKYVSENLITGPKNITVALNLLAHSKGHCNNDFSIKINSFGIANILHPNIFVQTYAFYPNITYNEIFYESYVRINDTTIFFVITNNLTTCPIINYDHKNYTMEKQYISIQNNVVIYYRALSLNMPPYNINELDYEINLK